MDWNTGMSWVGIGLAIFTWVASMIWHTLPRSILVFLFIVSVCLMLAWPMTAIIGLVRPFLKAPYGLILMILGVGILGGIVFGSAWYFTEPNSEPQPTVDPATKESLAETPEKIQKKLSVWVAKFAVFRMENLPPEPGEYFRFNIFSSLSHFAATVSMNSVSNSILIQSGDLFVFTDDYLSNLDDKDQLMRQVKLELLKIDVEYKIFQNTVHDFGFNITNYVPSTSLTQESFGRAIDEVSRATNIVQTMVQAKSYEIKSREKNTQ